LLTTLATLATTHAKLANNNTRYACKQQHALRLRNNNTRYACVSTTLATLALQQHSLRLLTATFATLANNNTRYAC